MKLEYTKTKTGKTLSRPATIIVDWNLTLVNEKWRGPFTWTEGAPEALRAFLKAGYEVKIHTCTLYTKTWKGSAPVDHQDRAKQYWFMRDLLDKEGFEEIEIITDIDKPPAIFYIDDKALNFNGNWGKVVRRVLRG